MGLRIRYILNEKIWYLNIITVHINLILLKLIKSGFQENLTSLYIKTYSYIISITHKVFWTMFGLFAHFWGVGGSCEVTTRTEPLKWDWYIFRLSSFLILQTTILCKVAGENFSVNIFNSKILEEKDKQVQFISV